MKKRFFSWALALVLLAGLGLTALAAGDKPILALGANLSEDQKNKVFELLGVDGTRLEDYELVYVTNEEEHQYLDQYLGAEVIGTRALSSVLIRPREKGSGLDVTTHNISYCTISMYKNALITAGLEDAQVAVAGPSNISGTSALIGAVKGYAQMTGQPVDSEALEAAVNELVVTGDIGELMGDSEAASDMVAYIKQKILEKGAKSDKDIEDTVRASIKEFDISLSEEQISRLTDLMHKIGKLDIDVDALKKQAGEVYEKLKEMGIDLEEVDKEQVGSFITRLFEAAVNFVKSLLA